MTLNEIKALCDELDELRGKATPGEWSDKTPQKDEDGFLKGAIVAQGHRIYADHDGGSFPVADRDLIIATHNALPTLSSFIRQAVALMEELESIDTYKFDTSETAGETSYKIVGRVGDLLSKHGFSE